MSHDPTSADTATRRRGSDSHRVIKGRRWRVSDPALDEELRHELVVELMDARRAVKQALADDNQRALAAARSRVGDAKVALGERGPKWWEPMSDGQITMRVESGLRALRSEQTEGMTFDDLRRRLGL